jgi:hypothetical protein
LRPRPAEIMLNIQTVTIRQGRKRDVAGAVDS